MKDCARECSEPGPTTTSLMTSPFPGLTVTEAGTLLSHFLSLRLSTRSSTPASLTWKKLPFVPTSFLSGEPVFSYHPLQALLTPLFLLKVTRCTSFGDGAMTLRFFGQKCSSSPLHPRDGTGRGLLSRTDVIFFPLYYVTLSFRLQYMSHRTLLSLL